MATITAANAIIMISIRGLFPIPQQLQGFATDDVSDTDMLESAEVLMGVDRRLSGGFVAVPFKQNYSLQADSASILIFDSWWAAQQAAGEVFPANGIIVINAIGKKWVLTRGFLTGYKPLPDIKKLLQPQKFSITWESSIPSVI